MVIIDTDIIIWLLRGNEEIRELFQQTVAETEGFIFITPVQIAEIFAGLRSREKGKTEKFLHSLNIIDISAGIGKTAGEFMNKFGKSHNVTLADALIAAASKE